MNYSKGDWFYRNGCIENGEHIICQMNNIGDKVEVDAHLIAAAPDMYEACQKVLLLLEEQYKIVIGSYPDYGTWGELELLRQTLAKARGEQ